MELWLAIVFLFAFIIHGDCQLPKWDSTCELPTDITCAQLSKDLERALLLDEGNLFRMRRAFFYSPTAAPVLLKVVYNVSFEENTTISDKECIAKSSTVDTQILNTGLKGNNTNFTHESTSPVIWMQWLHGKQSLIEFYLELFLFWEGGGGQWMFAHIPGGKQRVTLGKSTGKYSKLLFCIIIMESHRYEPEICRAALMMYFSCFPTGIYSQ